MDIYPKMEYKLIEQCQPGDLIRLVWWDRTPLAFIAKYKESESWLAVFLSDLPHIDRIQQPPLYVDLEKSTCQEKYALCYAKDWRIEISQDIENIKLPTYCSYEHKGALYIKNEQYFLPAYPFNPHYGNIRYINLTSGMVEKRPGDSVGIFLNWSLSLYMGSDRFQTLLSFPVKSEK